MSERTERFAEKSATVVGILAFVFWGIAQLWAIFVAIFGGSYPWPVSLFIESSSGGEWILAVIFFAVGGVLVGATVVVWNILVVLPLAALARARGE